MKYFGIDLGDGETAVATVTGAGAVVPQVLTLGNTKSILSLVGKDAGGNIVVGENVLLDFQMQSRTARFKSRFLRDKNAEEDIANFARGVFALVQSELAKERRENTRIALGCPAGWAEPDRERYAALVSLAGFPNVYTVSESRAAFMYAHHSSDLQLTAQQLSRPALVIDIGSSTTDFAHIVNGREANVGVFGDNSLGGGLLDYYLLEETIAACPNSAQLQKIFQDYPVWRNYCELDARKAKEAYFNAQNDDVESPCITRMSSVYLDVKNPITLNFIVNDDVIERLLNKPLKEFPNPDPHSSKTKPNFSFVEALDAALARAKATTADYPPELLILTGGASRMRFFQEACQKAFPDAQIIRCPYPEYSIAYGLSVAARTDHALSLFRNEVQTYFGNQENLRPEIIRYLPMLQEALSEVIVKGVLQGLEDVIAHSERLNRKQTETLFAQMANERLQSNEIQEEINRRVTHWMVEHLVKVQDDLNKMCDDHYIDRMDMSLAQMNLHYPVNVLTLSWRNYMVTVFGKLFSKLPWSLSGLARKSLEKQIRQSLVEPNGPVAKQLYQSLESELRRMINERIASIELLIH